MAPNIFDRHSNYKSKYRNNIDDKQHRRMANTDSNGVINDTTREEILNYHNNYRSSLSSGDGTVLDTNGNVYPKASNMNYLFWDDALANVAQNYAQQLATSCSGVSHNDNRDDDFYNYAETDASFLYPSSGITLGENIGLTYSNVDTSSDSIYLSLLDFLWQQSSSWEYQTLSSSGVFSAGSFTQIIWADTRYVGCGTYKCYDGSWYNFFLVCNYWYVKLYVYILCICRLKFVVCLNCNYILNIINTHMHRPSGNYLTQYPYGSGTYFFIYFFNCFHLCYSHIVWCCTDSVFRQL